MKKISGGPIQIEHLNAALQVIGINISAYYAGHLHTYRPIAAELRKLLCDYHQKKDISLLPQCFPGIHLHALAGDPAMIDEHTSLYIPATMSFDGKGGSDIDHLFNEAGPMFPLDQWLLQPLFTRNVTLKEFIRSVADKEGAHADKDHNHTLSLTKSVLFPGEESLAAKAIIAIARYIVKGIAIRSLIASDQIQPFLQSGSFSSVRGVAVMSLEEVCRNGVTRLPINFLPRAELHSLLCASEKEANSLAAFVDAYNPKNEYNLITLDWNGRQRSVYRIRF